jgi:hypothetical protein
MKGPDQGIYGLSTESVPDLDEEAGFSETTPVSSDMTGREWIPGIPGSDGRTGEMGCFEKCSAG